MIYFYIIMKIILQTISEFGNRFGPLISLYRICRKHDIEFFVLWEKQNVVNENKTVRFQILFNDLFKNKYIKLINKNTFNQIINDKKTYIFPKRTSGVPICQNNICSGYNILDLKLFNTYDNIVVTTTTHLIGLPTDPMHIWIPYTKKMGIYKEDDYIKELKYYFKEFEINEKILNIVNNVLPKFSKKMIGLQIRGQDCGGLHEQKKQTFDTVLNNTDEKEINSNAQLWHQDNDSFRMVKCFLYLNDIDENSGPFTITEENTKYENIYNYVNNEIKRIPEKVIKNNYTIKKLIGKKGTLIITNTHSYHRGGIPKLGNYRWVVHWWYSSCNYNYKANLSYINKEKITNKGVLKNIGIIF